MIAALPLVALGAAWSTLDAGALEAQVSALKALPVEERFVVATEGFLGTKYVLSPLGEGEGPDPDPLVRLDAADCVTMVEQAMALALTPSSAELIETLNHIRYASATPSYPERLHVMEAQWLPVNVARGLLEDVTRRLGGEATRRVAKRITAETWREKGGASLGLAPEAQVTGDFAFDLIPSERALPLLSTAPAGLVVVVVRADRPRLVSRITHVGVLIQKPEGPFLRHASRSFKRVVDEPLERYLKRNLEFGAWTVEGVSLFRIREPGWALSRPDAGAEPDGGPALAESVDAGAEAPAVVAVIDAGASPPAPSPSRPCGCASVDGLLLASLVWLLRSGRRVLA